MLDDHEAHVGDGTTAAALNGDLLSGELNDIGQIRLRLDSSLQLGDKEGATFILVYPIDLGDQPNRALGVEVSFREFDPGVPEFHRQPRLLCPPESCLAGAEPQAD